MTNETGATGSSDGKPLTGLSSAEVQQARLEAGSNTVPSVRTPAVLRLLHKFWAPVPWMLEVTVGLEAYLGKWMDAVLVAAVLLLNGAIGFLQEGRAQSALELLRSRLQVNARVLRDATWKQLPASELVPGDVVHVRMGDFVPADIALVDGEVLADQSSLTGESLPVELAAGASLYSGSVLMRGEATGRVTATGVRTHFGRTAELVGTSASAEHFGGLVMRMVRVFITIDFVLAASATTYLAVGGASWNAVASFAVVLLLASVPVALPAAFTLAGALGARRLAENGVLTTRLSVLQEAASMDVLCTDKTGTLTLNRLSVDRLVPAAGFTEAEVLTYAAAASDAATQDPLDLAILAHQPGAAPGERIAFTPFEPSTRRSESTFTTPQGKLTVTKGAPAAIAALTTSKPDAALQELADTGARVLAVAIRRDEGAWVPCGLVSLADSVRDDASAMLKRLAELGIRSIMVTGDGEQTAAAVARGLGMTGRVIPADQLDDPQLDLSTIAAVAQVLPERKHQLVLRLQQAGHTVGMTGDGVNDAPALRQAEVGIAVEGAADVAKAAAGAVLTRGGLADVVALVEESRRIHQRSLTYALNVSVKKIEVPVLLAVGVFAWRGFVFTPLLMALLLLVNDVMSMAIMTDSATPSHAPNVWRVRSVITGALGVALPMLVASLAVLWSARSVFALPLGEVRTIIFLTLVFGSQATIYVVRSGSAAWRVRPPKFVLMMSALGLAVSTLLGLAGLYMQQVPWQVVAVLLLVVVVASLVADAIKAPLFRRLHLHES